LGGGDLTVVAQTDCCRSFERERIERLRDGFEGGAATDLLICLLLQRVEGVDIVLSERRNEALDDARDLGLFRTRGRGRLERLPRIGILASVAGDNSTADNHAAHDQRKQ
jgi:hypothetical protein